MLNSDRHLLLTGEPGSGKSEVIVHAACAAAKSGACVLVLCPTGTRVHSYRDRLPDVDNIVVETIHSGFAIQWQYDKLVDYAPPSRLRRYDLILVDEASQIEDQVETLLLMGIQELPQLETEEGLLVALGRKVLTFLRESVYFCKAQVEAKEIVSAHWKQKHWFSCSKMYIFSDRRRYVGGRGNAKY